MLTPQFGLPLHHELVIDLFAGGGGASTGIEEAIGRPVDIGLRMLKPRELYRAQGFKDSYIIDWGIHPHTGEKIKLTSTASIRMCGNSVCPPMARAYVAANYNEAQMLREAA